MSLFTYHAYGPDGAKTTGELEANSRAEVFQSLEKQRLQPITIEQKSAAAAPSEKGKKAVATKEEAVPTGPIRLKRKYVIHFTEELSDLLDAGLQLEGALKVIEERQEKSPLKHVAARLRQQVRDGVSFSNALKNTSPSFGELYCNLVAAGEASGALPQILKRQVSYLVSMDDLRNSVVQALLYPALILGVGAMLLSFFMIQLVPNLMTLFSKTDQQVPLATRALIGMSKAFTGYWWLMLIMLIGAAIGIQMMLKSPAGRSWWDQRSHHVPLFGPVLNCRFLAQFCQTLSNLVSNGLPLLSGLSLMERATMNSFLRKKVSAVGIIVADGGALSRAMRRTGGFPDVLVDLVGVGEQTGDLPTALNKAAARYEKDMKIRIQRITALVGPVVLIFIAAVIGLMVYSIITSIFSAISGIRA